MRLNRSPAPLPIPLPTLADYYNDDRIVADNYYGIRAFVESEIKQLSNGVLTFARCE